MTKRWMIPGGGVLRRLLVGVLACLFLASPALGQVTPVEIEKDPRFGVGGFYRPGEFVALPLKLTAREQLTDSPAVPVLVQWEVPNADGDIAEYQRADTLTVGTPKVVWLYAPLSPALNGTEVWNVRVFLYEDDERGREIGGARIVAGTSTGVDLSQGMIGIVGMSATAMGLDSLQWPATQRMGAVPTSHEETMLVRQISSTDLPDRHEGLRAFEAIVWTDEPTPQSSTADALREWVRRGGHLIIVLPEDGNLWQLGRDGTEFWDVLPSKAPRKDEDVHIRDLLPVLAKSNGLHRSVDFTMGIHVFKEIGEDPDAFDALDRGYVPIMALPDGRVIVVQRLFGHGRITLVGIDVAQGRLSPLRLSNNLNAPIPEADVFWNRILGRRADTPKTLAGADDEDRVSPRSPGRVVVGTGPVISEEINMSGAAATGLLVALFLFIGYWIVAGPGGFAMLKIHRRVQHAWIAFAGAAGLFTAIAWASVSLLRASDISVQHLTFLDHIARPAGAPDDPSDPQLQRATSWFSIYLPGYGSAELDIDSMESQGILVPAQRDLLVSWTPPGQAVQGFPNVDRYAVDVKGEVDSFALPKRSTATQLYAQWLGPLDSEWGGMLVSDPNDPIRNELDAGGREVLRGSIINNLPATLEKPVFIWVRNRRLPTRGYAVEGAQEKSWVPLPQSGQPLNLGYMWSPGTFTWSPGIKYTPGPPPDNRGVPAWKPSHFLEENIYKSYYDEYNSDMDAAIESMSRTGQRRRDAMEILSFYQHMTPPEYLKDRNSPGLPTVRFERQLGRELDLSPWLSRPCLIVIGYLRDTQTPVPLRVDGKPVRSNGQTVVRWIYPLDVIEEIAFPTWEPVQPESDTQ